eukprot:TRINITY_DN43602_c0_g1_i1.p1 TRINITY_DN43602_c0_g1~~TRINITY_DN43602_c0_g1_i1.p1  ORF type:complete len:510 (+),score=54.35 TRINITY_DN43602_c0_g1_i1:57-1532(+)
MQGHGEQEQRRAPKVAEMFELPTLCLLVLATVAVLFALSWLQAVLVPLTVAAGTAQLFQPVLCILSRLPSSTCRCVYRLLRPLASSGHNRSEVARASLSERPGRPFLSSDGTGISLSAGPRRSPATESQDSARTVSPLSVEVDGISEAATGSMLSPRALDLLSRKRGRAACQRLQAWMQGLWDIISVLLCTVLLLGLVSLFVWGLVTAVEHFDYTKYKNSHKLDSLLNWLQQHGVNLQKLDWSSAFDMFRGQLLDTLSQLISLSEGIVLTALMFFFCLYAMLPSADGRGSSRSGVKRLMQQYLLYKTFSSAVIGLVCGLALKIMQVDLAEVFGLLTFVLNYIPNVGSAIAELIPLPLVLLDPDKTLSQAVAVFMVPFALHNTLGCIMEPKLMSHGLDLHPLTVVVALTFWSSVWGIAGAVLSVPITSVIRLWLEELAHPYAQTACAIINGPQTKGSRRARRRHSPSSSPSPPGSPEVTEVREHLALGDAIA